MSVRPSVRHAYFSYARKRVFSTIETVRDCAWRREVIGSDEGGREGGDEGGAIKDGASEEMTRGTHLTAVYAALFTVSHQWQS